MNNYNIFVRINYKDIGDNKTTNTNNTKINNRVVESNKYMIGGGILNKKRGGSIIFTAKSLDEIKEFTEKKILGESSGFQYNVGIIPKGTI